MSIRARLIFALTMLLGLMASQVLISVSLVSRTAAVTKDVTEHNLERIELITHLATDLLRLRNAELAANLADHGDHVNLGKQVNLALEDFNEEVKKYQDRVPLENQTALKTFLSDYMDFLGLHGKMLDYIVKGQPGEAMNLFVISQPTFDNLFGDIEILRQGEYSAARRIAQASSNLANQTRFLLSLALAVAAIVEIVLAWYLARSITSSLNTLLEATHRVAQGNLGQEVKLETQDEFAELAHSFNAMMRSLEATRRENTTLHDEALQTREQHIKTLRKHLSQVVRVQEDERQRVARELHDQAGQALTAVQLGLSHLEKQVSRPEIKEEAQQLWALVVSTMDEIRNIALDLRPSMLDDLGLYPALRQYSKEFTRRTGIPVELSLNTLPERLSSEADTAIFRVVQEGLTNIAKHAKATKAKLDVNFKNGNMLVTVSDNGSGFNTQAAYQNEDKRSLGLFGMQERVELLGGSFVVNSTPGEGTSLHVILPLHQEAHRLLQDTLTGIDSAVPMADGN